MSGLQEVGKPRLKGVKIGLQEAGMSGLQVGTPDCR